MKKIILFLLVIVPIKANAQDCINPYPSGDCAACFGIDYNPVCGCDGNNYRTECEAFNCANLLRDSTTICDYVDFEMRPTVFSNSPSLYTGETGRICVYMKYSGSAVVQIFNSYGKLMFETSWYAFTNDVFLPGNDFRGSTPEYYEIPVIANFERGVYIVVVSANSQIKSKKILKL